MSKPKDEDRWWRENFPTRAACAAADGAVDRLDPSLPMTTFLDAWIAAYERAGGIRPSHR